MGQQKNFKIGDKVIIRRKTQHDAWRPAMDETIGCKGEVIEMAVMHQDRCLVRIINSREGWWYNFDELEHADLDANKLVIGDEVMVIEGPNIGKTGYIMEVHNMFCKVVSESGPFWASEERLSPIKRVDNDQTNVKPKYRKGDYVEVRDWVRENKFKGVVTDIRVSDEFEYHVKPIEMDFMRLQGYYSEDKLNFIEGLKYEQNQTDVLEKLENTKIWTGGDEKVNRDVQNKLFELGFVWPFDKKEEQYLDADAYYIRRRPLSYSKIGYEYFWNHEHKEIFLSELFSFTSKPKFQVGDIVCVLDFGMRIYSKDSVGLENNIVKIVEFDIPDPDRKRAYNSYVTLREMNGNEHYCSAETLNKDVRHTTPEEKELFMMSKPTLFKEGNWITDEEFGTAQTESVEDGWVFVKKGDNHHWAAGFAKASKVGERVRQATPEEIEKAKNKPPQITINDYTAEFGVDGVYFGCAVIDKQIFLDVNHMLQKYYKGNRYIEEVKIGKGTFTIHQIKQIADYYKDTYQPTGNYTMGVDPTTSYGILSGIFKRL